MDHDEDTFAAGALTARRLTARIAEIEAALASMTENAATVMRYLDESGGNVVPHLMDTDDNPGQRLREDIDAARAALATSKEAGE